MSKFNAGTVKAVARGVITSAQTSTGTTHQGGPGFERDPKSELFLLAVTNFVSEDSFYERASDRDTRYSALVTKVANTDPQWLIAFGRWLRTEANMRSAALVLAAEAVASGVKGFRPLVSAVLVRADEPGEMLAYWINRYGKAFPKPLKRGIADAAQRLYTERNVLKYDTASHTVRFADVIRLCHVDPKADWQSTLFHHLIAERIGVEGHEVPATLRMITANRAVRALSPDEAVSALTEGRWAKSPSEILAEAGMTWEAIPSLVNGPWTASLWEAQIPNMGYMALLRNLRNFDQAGITDRVAKKINDRLSDPGEVASSRQLPLRFLSAFNAAPSLRWSWALEQALEASLANIPALGGRTLILIDTSGSMAAGFSKDGTLKRWDAAAMFGLALAKRCASADVVSYAGGYYSEDTLVWDAKAGESLLKSLDRWKNGGWFLNGGTDTPGAVARHYAKHDRVVILTDEQTAGWSRSGRTVDQTVPATVPLHTFNLAGYRLGHSADKANRYTYGGLTDGMFTMMHRIEQGLNGRWPWETEAE